MLGDIILSNFENRRIQNATPSKRAAKLDLDVEFDSVEALNLKGLKKLLGQNLSIKNIRGFYGMMSDVFLLLVGKESELLLNGVFHVLHAKCTAIKIDQYNVQMILHVINGTTSSLRLFYRLFKQIVRKINVKWSVDMSNNVYMRNMENNLYQMIKILSVNNYPGTNDFSKVDSMKKVLNAEYGDLIIPIKNHTSVVEVKLNFIAKSIDSLKDILYVLQ